jgi:1,4-dihydroxy-6-naphthoate synthase
MSDKQYDAIDKLFSLGFERGFYDAKLEARDFLIPIEYKELRES